MQKSTTLISLARYDKGIVPGETVITDEGYIKARAIVTRCGVFLYKNADGTIRKELRHPDDVLVPESLESIKMIPVVNGHPPERLVNSDNAKKLAIGYTGELVENQMPYIVANLLVTDKDAVDEIKNKKKNELSLGYTVDLIPDSGTYNGEPYEYRQTNIRYNHLALVDQARAGPEARIALDGDDAEEILKEEAEVAKRKIKIDAEEYMLEDDAAAAIEKLMNSHHEYKKGHEDFLGKHKALQEAHDKMMAERDSLRDKDYHDPESVHHPLENDEIGSKGKEEKDPLDTYGMQSHVRDYEKPSEMENHAVMSPKNEHYPKDLPHVAKVDAAEIDRRVKNRVKLEKIAERYLDRESISRLDSLSDIEIKKRLIMNVQPNANLQGKSEVYINARFDSVIEDMPGAKVIAQPVSKFNADSDPEKEEKDRANAFDSRKKMIQRQKVAYKGGK
ncbi:MAG: hypothetical protein C5B43_03970 [Verrucomicrobia bacterium]|nr:MAG: hypothetical protein C5B43_03970 [Verrucomicrobiota bacterium]